MSRRIEQVNELFKEKLGLLISREIPMDNGLITITQVDVTPDLQYAKIWVSVLPDNLSGTALKKLRQMNSVFSAALRREVRLRQIPKFNWVIDNTEKNAAEIERAVDEALKDTGDEDDNNKE